MGTPAAIAEKLPEGFTLDPPTNQGEQLPAGFVLDSNEDNFVNPSLPGTVNRKLPNQEAIDMANQIGAPIPENITPINKEDLSKAGKGTAKGLGLSALQVAGAPGRVATDIAKAFPYAQILAGKFVEKLDPWGTKGPAIIKNAQGQLNFMNQVKENLTFVDEGLTDTGLSFALGGGAGAGIRALIERPDAMARLARAAGITESLLVTGVKSGLVAAAGDKFVIDPALTVIQDKVGKSELSDTTKELVLTTSPLLLGLISGATIEFKMDKLLKNPLAVGLFNDLAKTGSTADDAAKAIKKIADDGKLPDVFDNLKPESLTKNKAVIQPGAEFAPEIKTHAQSQAKTTDQRIQEQRRANQAEINKVSYTQPSNVRGSELPEGFKLDKTPNPVNPNPRRFEGGRTVRDPETVKISPEEYKDPGSLIRNRINRKFKSILDAEESDAPHDIYDGIQEGTLTTEQLDNFISKSDNIEKAVKDSKGAIADRIGDLIETHRYESSKEGYELEDYLEGLFDVVRKKERELSRNFLPNRKPIPEAVTPEKPKLPDNRRIAKPKTSQVRTLRGAIKKMGGINFLNFRGELKELPVASKYLSRKAGTPLDLAEQQLRDEGWLDEGEDLLTTLRDPERLKRGRRDQVEEFSKPEREMSKAELKIKRDLDWEPEEPPPGDYDFVEARNLPDGKTVTIIDNKGGTGWDLYKVKKTKAGVYLEDGSTYKVGPRTEVQVLKADLSGAEVGAKAVKSQVKEDQAEFTPIRLPIKERRKLVELNFKGKKPAGDRGEAQGLFLTGGPPGAGKSTSVKSLGVDMSNHVKADADMIKEQAGFEHKAAEFHEQSSEINKAIADRAIKEGYDLAYDSLLTNYPLADDLIQRVLKKGGTVDIGFTNIDAITSVVRSRARVDGGISKRIIPEKASLKGYNRALPTFIELFKKYKNDPDVRFSLVDNNVDGRDAIPIFTKTTKEGVEIFNKNEFDKLMDTDYIKIGSGKEVRYERRQTATLEQLRSHRKQIKERSSWITEQIRAKKEGRSPDKTVSGRTTKARNTPTNQVSPKKPSQNTLQVHPSTITGPVGALAAGVDWEEYEKTGEIKINPKRMFVGAVAGATLGAAFRPSLKVLSQAATKWDDTVTSKLIDPLKNKVNGLIVNEDIRHGLGLNRSEKFKDMMRDYHRDVTRAWNKATEIGKAIQEVAPTKLEQRRLMQIIKGGITSDSKMRAAGEKINKMFADYRKLLEDADLLHYSRFDELTRKERAKLRNIIAKDKSDKKLYEDEFLRAYNITPDNRPDPPMKEYRINGDNSNIPDYAKEEIPVEAYADTPKSSAEWARSKLHDHYHFGSAKEYAPIFYRDKEGLTPKQREILEDEIKNFKIKSRRGNPEGVQWMEAMIAKMEEMLGTGWKARRAMRITRQELNKRYSHRRLEMPDEVQKMMGRIDEAAFPIAKMAGVQSSDIIKGRLFKDVSNNSAWAMPKQAFQNEVPKNWIMVSDEKFGALDGMYVRKDIWDDLREVEEWRGAFVRNWDKMLGAWKYGKVVLNPATHARNFMSNMILAYFGDVNPGDVKTYTKALKSLNQGEDNIHFKEADDWGLFNDTFVSSEIIKMRDDLDAVQDGAQLKSWIKTAFEKPAELYQGNEKLFKMAVFIKARESGMDVDAAARKAEKFLFNYADIPPWVKHTKRWVSPFFTFTYKAVPVFAEMAIRKPWKVGAVMAATYGMEEFSRNQLGMSDEEADRERKLLPAWQQRKILGVGPYTQVLMPFKDKWGNNLYLDTAYILPYGNLGEKWGQSAIPLSDLLPSNPLFQLGAEILTNKESFTGRPIYNELIDGQAKVLQKYAELAWRELTPSLAPGGYGFNKMKTGIKNSVFGGDERDWADRPIDFQTAALSTLFGIKLSPANEEKLMQFEYGVRQDISRGIQVEVSKLKTKLKRNAITKAEFDDQAKELYDLKRKLLKERPK